MAIVEIQELVALKSNKQRLLGLDVGTKTIGLALSDTSWQVATAKETIARTKFKKDLSHLQNVISAHDVCAFVIGLPINMDGSEGPRCQSVRQFAQNLLEQIHLPMIFWDERMSTMAVTRMMIEADLSRKRRDELVDKLAASYILQGALDYINNHSRQNS